MRPSLILLSLTMFFTLTTSTTVLDYHATSIDANAVTKRVSNSIILILAFFPFSTRSSNLPGGSPRIKPTCHVCNTSYSLKYAKLHKDAIDPLGLQRAKKGQYDARGDGDWPCFHQATSHRPPASELHGAISLHWLAEITRWEKLAPPFGRNPSQPLSNPSIRKPLSSPSAKFNKILANPSAMSQPMTIYASAKIRDLDSHTMIRRMGQSGVTWTNQ